MYSTELETMWHGVTLCLVISIPAALHAHVQIYSLRYTYTSFRSPGDVYMSYIISLISLHFISLDFRLFCLFSAAYR